MVRDALDDAGVPAVINGAGSVFATEPARDVAGACSRRSSAPPRSARARSAALTPFVGWTADQLARADENGGGLGGGPPPLHDWARVLRGRGVASLLTTITAGEGLPARMLALEDGSGR